MHYAILCYASEEIVCAWTAEQERTTVEALDAVGDKIGSTPRSNTCHHRPW